MIGHYEIRLDPDEPTAGVPLWFLYETRRPLNAALRAFARGRRRKTGRPGVLHLVAVKTGEIAESCRTGPTPPEPPS